MPSVKTKMRIEVDPSSIIKNITNFFSNELALIPELLQNCRRAEASNVNITVDFKTNEFIVEDDGHGVMDPKALITIGKSDWSSKTVAEMPAGMGLFSSFKIGQRLSVFSGNWHLEIDFSKRNLNDAVTLEYGLAKRTGAKVVIHFDPETFRRALRKGNWSMTSSEAAFVAEDLNQTTKVIKRVAEVMPFSSKIRIINPPATIDKAFVGAANVDAFNPSALGPVAEAKLPTGRLYFFKAGELGAHVDNNSRGFFVSQGVRFKLADLDNELGFGYALSNSHAHHPLLDMVVVADAGTVDFSLPDRDKILDNKKVKPFIADIKKAMFTALTTAMHDLVAKGTVHWRHEKNDAVSVQLLQTFAVLFSDKRDALPKEFHYVLSTDIGPVHLDPGQLVRVGHKDHDDLHQYVLFFTDYTGQGIRHLVGPGGYVGSWPRMKMENVWVEKFFPDSVVVKSVELDVETDPRSEHFIKLAAARLRTTTGSIPLEITSELVHYVSDCPSIAEFEERDNLGVDTGLQAASADVTDDKFASTGLVMHTYGLDKVIGDDVEFGRHEDNIRYCTESELPDDGNGDIAWYSEAAYLAIKETSGEFPAAYSSFEAFMDFLTYKLNGLGIDKFENTVLDFKHHGSRGFHVVQVDVIASAYRYGAFPKSCLNGLVVASMYDKIIVKLRAVEHDRSQLEIVETTLVPEPKKTDSDKVAEESAA